MLLTPVFFFGEFHGLSSPWGRKELDTMSNFHFLIIYSVHFVFV